MTIIKALLYAREQFSYQIHKWFYATASVWDFFVNVVLSLFITIACHAIYYET